MATPNAGDPGARAPGEHEPRYEVLGPPPHRAWRHLDRAVQPALAPVLGLDVDLARPRLPRVPLGFARQPALAPHGRHYQDFPQGGMSGSLMLRSHPMTPRAREKN